MTIDWTKPLEWVTASDSTEDVIRVVNGGTKDQLFGCEVKSGTVWSNADGVLCVDNCGYIRNRAEPSADTETPTLRDQFAMAALQGLCAQTQIHAMSHRSEDTASKAYRLADAMMDARK